MAGDRALAGAGDRLRQPHVDRARRADARRCWSSAKWRPPCCCSSAPGLLLRTLLAVRQRRSRLSRRPGPDDDGRPARLALSDAANRCCSSSTPSSGRSAPCPESAAWPGRARCRWATSYAGSVLFEIVGDPPLDDSRAAGRRLPDREPAVLRARSIFRSSPAAASTTATPRDSVAGLHRERSVRPPPPAGPHRRSACASRSAPAAAPQAAAGVREIVGVARQVKGRPDETEDLVQVYVPMAQDLLDDIFLLVRPASGRADALRAGRPRGDRPHRQGAAGQRQGRDDARGRRLRKPPRAIASGR